MKKPKFGPTGNFPRGKLGPDDEGGLRIGVAHDSKGNVIINFGTEISWLGFPPEQAIQLAKSILHHAGIKKFSIEIQDDGEISATITVDESQAKNIS